MATIDELNESLNNQDRQEDELLNTIRSLNALSPRLEERRMERDAKRKLINTAPPEFLEEFAPKLLQVEKDDEQRLGVIIPGLTNSAKDVLIAFNSTGGTISPYVSGTHNYARSASEASTWVQAAMQPFSALATYKLQRADVPTRLNNIHQGLGEMFSAALESTDRAKARFELQSNSILAMRSFLESLWGNLLELARQSKPLIWKGIQRSRLSQADVRELIAKSLASDQSDERKLVALLQSMSDLHNDMSDSEVGKNLGFDDLSLHNDIFTRWFLIIDDLLTIVK